MDREAIRTRLIEIRKKAGLSMDRLAAKLRLSKNAVFLIENNTNFPAPETLEDWLSVGHVHMHYLIRDHTEDRVEPMTRLLAHLHDLPAATIAELAEGVASGGSLAAIPAGYARRYAAVEPGLEAALSFATTPEARAADLDGIASGRVLTTTPPDYACRFAAVGMDPSGILLLEVHAPPAVLRRLEIRAPA